MRNTDTAQAAKFHKLATFHFAKAAEGGDRAGYYVQLAEGEAIRAEAAAARAGMTVADCVAAA